MKKIAALIVLIVALGAQAIANNLAELNIRTLGSAPMKVVIDGKLVSQNGPIANIKSIPAGYHNVQIFRVLNNYNSYNEEPLFIGQIFLPKQTVTNALVKQNKFLIEEQFALNINSHRPQATYPQYDNVQYGHNSPNGNHHSNHPNENFPRPHQQSTQCGFTPSVVAVHRPLAQVPVQVFPMNAQLFNQLKASIANQWFSDGKMAVINQAVQANFFTTQQVNELINMFSYSSDRLEVAKMAYTKTVDPENYFMVYDSLQWNSSIQNLSNYIASL